MASSSEALQKSRFLGLLCQVEYLLSLDIFHAADIFFPELRDISGQIPGCLQFLPKSAVLHLSFMEIVGDDEVDRSTAGNDVTCTDLQNKIAVSLLLQAVKDGLVKVEDVASLGASQQV
jgi:hypothetical protein